MPISESRRIGNRGEFAEVHPTVSIIMFVRNRADMIRKAIDSVLGQKYPKLQFVIQDGASTDGTVDVIRSYGDQIDLLSEPDEGVHDGFWRGLQRARGEIIGTCLSDETMMPGAIQRAVAELRRRPRAGAITGDAVVSDVLANTCDFHTGSDFNLLAYLLGDYCPHFATSFFRRQALIDVGFFSDRWKAADIDTVEFEIWCRLGLESSVEYVPHLFARWTVHDAQMSQNVGRIAEELTSRTNMIDRYLFGEGNFFGENRELRNYIIKRQHDIIIYHLLAHGQKDDARAIDDLRIAALGSGSLEASIVDRESLPSPPSQLSRKDRLYRGKFFHQMVMAYRDRGQVDEAIGAGRYLKGLNSALIDTALPQLSLASPTASEVNLEQEQVDWARRYANPGLIKTVRTLPKKLKNKKLKIAYNSTLWNIPTGQAILLPVMAAHDRNKIQLVGYSKLKQPQQIVDLFDEFYETERMSDERFVDFVRGHKVDVLIETNGMSEGNRLAAMSARCASIQVSYVNHAGTLGVPNIDYLITDRSTLQSLNRGFYTERLYALNGCFLSYDYKNMRAPEPAQPPFKRNRYITFGCFGGPYKLNIDCLLLWAGVMKVVPESRLILQNTGLTNSGNADFIRRRLGAMGIASHRIDIMPGAERDEILENYSLIDISLDSWPYCGGNTIAESLWQGVPAVTLKGDRFASAYGASLLKAAGLGDLVATDPEEFCNISSSLARDKERLVTLRSDLREMMKINGLSDSKRMAGELEDAFFDMIKRMRVNP
jgi:glycosyltransferase involved in cell wall biosynthesis